MQLIIFFIMLAASSAAVLLINYFRVLFSDGRNEYSRSEILSVQTHLLNQWNLLIAGDASTAYISLTVGVFIGLLFSFAGGSGSFAYIIHSALLPGLWFVAIPFLKEQFEEEIQKQSIIGKLVENDIPFFFAFSSAIIAQNFTIYGISQKISFFWIVLNNAGITALILYRFFQKETEPLARVEENSSEE